MLEAERWGDEVLQPLVRRLCWGALKHNPRAIPSYQEASQLPQLPGPVVRLAAPGVIAVARRMHHASDDAVRADLRALPGHLDRVDGWIADGVLGSDPDQPNAADLQIGSSLRLLGDDRRRAAAARRPPLRGARAAAVPRLPRRRPGGRAAAGLARREA